jgi:hypothetical protein
VTALTRSRCRKLTPTYGGNYAKTDIEIAADARIDDRDNQD